MNSINTDLIEKFVAKYGSQELESYINNRLNDNENNTLTIIGNSGLHTIPNEHLHGEVYIASSGNLDLSTKESTTLEYEKVLSKLIKKLQEKSWNKIYFVPTGHTTLVLQIKLIVYNILRISTIDLFYSKGGYFELEIDYRELLSNKNS